MKLVTLHMVPTKLQHVVAQSSPASAACASRAPCPSANPTVRPSLSTLGALTNPRIPYYTTSNAQTPSLVDHSQKARVLPEGLATSYPLHHPTFHHIPPPSWCYGSRLTRAGALERAGIRPGDGLVDEVLMGNVITGNLGQVRRGVVAGMS